MSEELEFIENNGNQPPQAMMLQMIFGFWVSRIIYVAAKLGIADILADGAKSSEEIAAKSGAHAPSLYRLLRALVSVGIFSEDDEKRFALTPLGATLKSDGVRSFAIAELGEDHYVAWGNLIHSVRTGERAFDNVFGMPVWQYYAEHPENGAIFNQAMTDLTIAVEAAVMEAYDFSPFEKIVDVGGGHGSFLASILKANTRAQGVLFDAPQVVDGAKQRLEAEGLTTRCSVVGGDFFEAVPDGGDLYVMKMILHDWDETRSRTILENCHRAMKENGKLAIVEQVVPSGNEPSPSKLIDINMLVMTGGRERTAEEFASLFESAGFKLTNVVGTNSLVSIIEGVRV
ncbi:MAG TPA: methyltransferase [Pyrinomonadaceae bacterium]|nr:methyltransferase [Pyrinomonadaceae bacterium]